MIVMKIFLLIIISFLSVLAFEIKGNDCMLTQKYSNYKYEGYDFEKNYRIYNFSDFSVVKYLMILISICFLLSFTNFLIFEILLSINLIYMYFAYAGICIIAYITLNKIYQKFYDEYRYYVRNFIKEFNHY